MVRCLSAVGMVNTISATTLNRAIEKSAFRHGSTHGAVASRLMCRVAITMTRCTATTVPAIGMIASGRQVSPTCMSVAFEAISAVRRER